MEKTTIILHDAPYGSDKTYNGLRTAMSLQKRENIDVNVFLFADATFCAVEDQISPQGFYNIGRMIRSLARRGKVGVCGACSDIRGLSNIELIENVSRSSMDELTDWILESEKVLSF